MPSAFGKCSKIKSILVLSGLLYCSSVCAQVDINSGGFIKKLCEDRRQNVACLTYIMGFTQGVDSQAYMDDKKSKYCTPDGVNNEQVKSVFIKYLNDHPEDLHIAGGELLYVSLMKAFPCTGQKQK